MTVAAFINRLLECNSLSRYLEIGVAEGVTFVHVNAESKTAVDPHPKFSPKSSNEILVKTSSDEFFQNYKGNDVFDFIYLDGLHTAVQTTKDFLNSLRFASDNTIWLIDDIYPDSWASAAPSLAAYRFRRALSLLMNPSLFQINVGWQGDVWRMVGLFNYLRPHLSFKTVVGDSEKAQLVVFSADIAKIIEVLALDFADPSSVEHIANHLLKQFALSRYRHCEPIRECWLQPNDVQELHPDYSAIRRDQFIEAL